MSQGRTGLGRPSVCPARPGVRLLRAARVCLSVLGVAVSCCPGACHVHLSWQSQVLFGACPCCVVSVCPGERGVRLSLVPAVCLGDAVCVHPGEHGVHLPLVPGASLLGDALSASPGARRPSVRPGPSPRCQPGCGHEAAHPPPRYDIKGCRVDRWAEPASAVVLKDLNFEGKSLVLGKAWGARGGTRRGTGGG